MSGSNGILVAGASGTIGKAVVRELVNRGHNVTCLMRAHKKMGKASGMDIPNEFDGAQILYADTSKVSALSTQLCSDDSSPFKAVISCMASRTGEPKDAWAVDYQANSNLLNVAKNLGIQKFVLLSAICVQKPRLAFQHAKLAFEEQLQHSGLEWSIIRPTAFFKSLSGQIERVRKGKPFLVFGDGQLTACKPISDEDLARYIVSCLDDPDAINRIMPIGGPGPAITPLQQGEALFAALGRVPKYSHVPPTFLKIASTILSAIGYVIPSMASKAELARIGYYYATESMLVYDPQTQRYDANATPEFGRDTLGEHYARLAKGEVKTDLGDHAVF